MTPRLVLLRHARAGDREDWVGDDRLRPLDEKGRRRADELVEPLLALGVARVVSSPYVRCVQTVEPLARRLRAELELDDALAEGAYLEDTLGLLGAATVRTVFCTHGDVVENVLGEPLRKGAAALLALDGGRVRPLGRVRRSRTA